MYTSKLSTTKTQQAISLIKSTFSDELLYNLNLQRVSAPMFVTSSSGLNDNLNGIETPVSFTARCIEDTVEVVHSLAKWKREALHRYGFPTGRGIYTDMNAIRKDEILDNTHSMYVDQWDWELVIDKSNRNISFLKHVVNKLYNAVKRTACVISDIYSGLNTALPDNVTFITSQELEDVYPDETPERREYLFSKEHGAILIIGIGGKLRSGNVHGSRAPDYDDWNLNGDLIFYYPVLDCALEISSMGIRVDRESLLYQLSESGIQEESFSPYHKKIISNELPLTVGGGIGQSRLSMFLLEKMHIGEVQASVWDRNNIDYCRKNNIILL